MKQEYILQIIQGPLVTEKSSSATAKKQLVFKVARKATKEEIKEAVEQLLEVTVVAVNTINVKGKSETPAEKVGIKAHIISNSLLPCQISRDR